MWALSLMLLCATGFVAAVASVNCPTNCRCDRVYTIKLTVDCHGSTNVSDDQLSDQVDSLLSSSRITYLRIVNTPLTHVPRSVCRLTTLRQLHLDNNRLTRLPDNCLTNLSNLVRFSAHDNAIEMLQDGVFDGLTKLQHLNLERNSISSIGLSVFRTSSNLASLFNIILSKNNLTSLEPWVLDRGLIGSIERRVQIYLNYNKISKFTNEMKHNIGHCHNKIPFADVFLENNKIKYILDILTGWQISFTQALSCYRIKNGVLNFLVMTDGNDIACDCVNYSFYRLIGLQNTPQGIVRIVRCNLFDPLTGNWSTVNGFGVDLNLFVCELTERCPVRCVCVHRPDNVTLHIYCSNRNLTVLPLELPELPNSLTSTKYKIDLSNNQLIRHLEYRGYFLETSFLDVSNCGIDNISDWEEISKIPYINLSGNKIASLPQTFLSTNYTSSMMNLANNPWNCSCDNKWMSKWFKSVADRLTQNVLCHTPSGLSGKNIMQVSDQEFCPAPSKTIITTLTVGLSTVVGIFVIVFAVGFITYRQRVQLYTRWKFHPFDRDECLGEDMDYDVFLSCSSSDNLPHGNEIRQQLEQHGYRVCYPPRDFVAGDAISQNIYNAVVHSKRTVCFLTENFCERLVSLSH